jgi:hypothetical protein
VLTALPAMAPTPKTVDGSAADWTGEAPGFSGLSSYSAGEYVYADYLFDAFGADDGDDAERVARNDALERPTRASTGSSRPTSTTRPARSAPQQRARARGGAAVRRRASTPTAAATSPPADLREVRVAADATTVSLLVRTTTMTAERSAGVVVLADTVESSPAYDVPFGSGPAHRAGRRRAARRPQRRHRGRPRHRRAHRLPGGRRRQRLHQRAGGGRPARARRAAAKQLPSQAQGKAKGHKPVCGSRSQPGSPTRRGARRPQEREGRPGERRQRGVPPGGAGRIRFDKRQASRCPTARSTRSSPSSTSRA